MSNLVKPSQIKLVPLTDQAIKEHNRRTGDCRAIPEANVCKVAAASVVIAKNVRPSTVVIGSDDVCLDVDLQSDSSSDSEENMDIYCFLRYTVCLPCTACCFAFLGGG